MITRFPFLLLFFAGVFANAQNPAVQTRCTPDPAPYVYNDTLWVFTGHDEDTATYFRMRDWQLYSTTDMVNFTYRGTPLSTETFSWATHGDNAWASQAVCRGGKWYWYVAAEDGSIRRHGIGVAVADRPEGPYSDPIGKPLVPGDWGRIDPTVFVDDDGSAWLFWGNNGLWYAELADDMVSFKGDIVQVDVDDTTAFGPHALKMDYGLNKKRMMTGYEEAPWVYKVGDTYFLEYAAGGVPEHWAYSTSKSIRGPWVYRGRVMGEAPNSFTIHGGSISYHGRDFMFYHNGLLPWGGGYHRSTAVEEFKRAADGSIPFVPFTDGGVVTPVRFVDASRRVEAETMAACHGVTTDQSQGSFHYVASIDDGDWVKVRAVDFGKRGAMEFRASVACAKGGGRIEVRLDAPDGEIVSELSVEPTCHEPELGRPSSFRQQRCKARGAVGVHDVYLVFRGDGHDLFLFDWWQM